MKEEPGTSEMSVLFDLLYQPWIIDGDDCAAIVGMNEWQGKSKYSERTCPSPGLFTTDP
jgi:hypothetical protein